MRGSHKPAIKDRPRYWEPWETGNGRLAVQCVCWWAKRERAPPCLKIPSIRVCLHTCESCVQQTRRENSLTAAWEWGSVTLIKQLLCQQTNTNTQMHTQGYPGPPSVHLWVEVVCVFMCVCVCFWWTHLYVSSPSCVCLHCQIVSTLMLFAQQHLGCQPVTERNVCICVQ